MNARIKFGSFTPGALSTPEETSAPGAAVARIASATFAGVSPPASNHGAGADQPLRRDQSKTIALPPGRVAPAGAFVSMRRRSAAAVRGRSAAVATPIACQTATSNFSRIATARSAVV